MGGPGSLSLKPVGSLPNEPIPEAQSHPPPSGPQNPSGGPQEIVDVSNAKVAPDGANNVVEGEGPGHGAAPAEPPPKKISTHEQFVLKLYAEVSKLTTKRSVDELDKQIKTAVEGTDVDTSRNGELGQLVKDVGDSVAALNMLTGRQIADFAYAADKTAYKALTGVLNAYEALAFKLTKLGEGEKDPEVSRRLQMAANGLNQRICAITRLVGELNARLLRGESGELDLRNQFDRVGQLVDERSGASADRMAKLKKLTKPLEAALKDLTSNDRPITKEMVDAAQEKLQEIRGTVQTLVECADAHERGEPVPENARKALEDLGWSADEIGRVPQSVFDDIRQVLDRAASQLGQAHLQQTSKEAALRMVAALRMPRAELMDELRKQSPEQDFILGTGSFSKLKDDLLLKYDACKTACVALQEAVRKEVDGANPVDVRTAIDAALLSLSNSLEGLNKVIDSGVKFLNNAAKNAGSIPGDDEQIKALCTEWTAKLNGFKKALNVGGGVSRFFADQIAKIRELIAERKDGSSWYDPQVLSRILDEPEVFMAVVEARVHGIDLSLVDLDCSTKNLVEKKPLGSGAFSTAYLCTFQRPDGSTVQRVFKPDFAATAGLNTSLMRPLVSSGEEPQKALNHNVALYDVATLLGADSVVCRSSAAYVNGEFGFLMEVAPGVDVKTASLKKTFGKELTLAAFKKMEQGRKLDVFAQLAVKFSQLQWTDLIGGQLDRHARNYAVHVTNDGIVSVKGYDNDVSLAAELVGIGKVRVPNWEHLEKVFNRKNPERTHPDFMSRGKLKAAFMDPVRGKKNAPGQASYSEDKFKRVTFDVRKLKTGRHFQLLIESTGLRYFGVPSYMDRGTYDRIKALTKADGSGLKLFRETLQKRGMSPEQIDAAVTRLLEASEIADDLMKAGRVYTREELAKPESLREIQQAELDSLNERFGVNPSSPQYSEVLANLTNFGADYLCRAPFRGLIANEARK